MSTAAAPAAGASAPATPAAAPLAPGEAAGGPESQPTARTLKPIPASKPRIPGVMDDGPEPATTRPREISGRDPVTGRFTKGEGAAAAPIPGARPDAAPPSDGDPTNLPEPPEAKPKFKFGSREFADQAAAEQHYKSLEGRFEPIQRKATEYEGKLVKAAESARGWHAEAQRLQAELEQLRAGKSAPEAAAAPADAPGIDWALFAEINRVASEAGTPEKAQQWLVEQMEAVRKADFERWRNEFETPFREREMNERADAERARMADAVVADFSSMTNPDGTPAFPEAADGETMRAVGELWSSLGLDPDFPLQSRANFAVTIALYRMATGMRPSDPAPTVPPPPDPAALAAAGLEGGRPSLPAAGSRRELEPGVARIVAGLRDTNLLNKNTGFER